MKIILLQPPIQDFYDTDIRHQPVGLCYLKAAIKKYLPEVEAEVRDYHHGWGRKSIGLPRELRYLRDIFSRPDKSPFCGFYHYYHFGADFEVIGREIAAAKPDLVGISSLFSPYYREVLDSAAAIKNHYEVPIVLGGAHASACPEMMLASPAVDYVIRGEGERPLI